MCKSCNHEIDKIWRRLAPGLIFRTPDSLKGVNFAISNINNDFLKIKTGSRNIKILKDAFIQALHYLNNNGHDEDNKCKIRSSNDPEDAGALCRNSRQVNSNVRCINYILPILAEYDIVIIDGRRPNRTWLRLK